MARSNDYPRMLFHRMEDPVTVHSREEEEALGADWSRTIWPAELPLEPDAAAGQEEDAGHHGNGETSAFEPAPKHHKTKKRR